jgi:hypothetical protein
VIAVAAQVLRVPYDIWLIRQYPLVAITFVSEPVYLHGWRSFRAGQGKSARFRPGEGLNTSGGSVLSDYRTLSFIRAH